MKWKSDQSAYRAELDSPPLGITIYAIVFKSDQTSVIRLEPGWYYRVGVIGLPAGPFGSSGEAMYACQNHITVEIEAMGGKVSA